PDGLDDRLVTNVTHELAHAARRHHEAEDSATVGERRIDRVLDLLERAEIALVRESVPSRLAEADRHPEPDGQLRRVGLPGLAVEPEEQRRPVPLALRDGPAFAHARGLRLRRLLLLLAKQGHQLTVK